MKILTLKFCQVAASATDNFLWTDFSAQRLFPNARDFLNKYCKSNLDREYYFPKLCACKFLNEKGKKTQHLEMTVK